jgi:CRP/FNR family transcriptional regulator, polysaccharide utilization system transcription regulator
MKFSRNSNCALCVLKCDIYFALAKTGSEFFEFKPLHALFKKHDIICKQNSEVTHALFLIRGSAKLYIEGINNRNIILNILKPPAYIGLLSFFESPNYSYSVSALDESEVCFIELDLVKKLYLENHELLLSLNKAFGKSVLAIMNKIVSINQKQVRGRIAENLIYLSELHGSHNFNLGLSRKEFGELAAISEENTVRLLSEFSKEKIIEVNGKEIEILDMSLLKRISDFG